MLPLMILVDQYTKNYVRLLFNNSEVIKINSFLSLISTWNKGISFGLLNEFLYSNLIFLVIGTVIIIILFAIFLHSRNIIITIGSTVVIAGAIGNLIDRLRFGAVYDFINLNVYDWSWPAFNIADSMVCFGVLILFIGELSDKKSN